MEFFSRFNPLRAWRDLRNFLLGRGKVELAALFIAALITAVVIGVFARNATPEVKPERTIIYVQQWPASRSDDQIKAQQKVDAPKEAAARAEVARQQEKRRQEFKRLDDKLRSWGI
jgi:hypothetical protein